jgi:hypothetical protein
MPYPLSVVILQDAHDDIALPLSVDKHAVTLPFLADKATYLVDGDSSAVAGKDAKVDTMQCVAWPANVTFKRAPKATAETAVSCP